eukprot:6490668-Amphidinium_carterae.4
MAWTRMVEQLHLHGAHLHAVAMVLPGLHNPMRSRLTGQSTQGTTLQSLTVIVGEIKDIRQQANIPKQLRQPPQPTKQEQEQHQSTHMPYDSLSQC